MVQTGVTAEWLLEGFKYELGATRNSKTVTYYCGHLYRFLRWASHAGVPKESHRIEKRHIEAFFYHLLQEIEAVIGGNGAQRKVTRTERSLWPYFRSLRRFFGWAVNEGYLKQNPMGSIKIKRPANRPIEPWRPEHINRLFQVIDNDLKIAHTHRQKMLAARDRAVVSLFLDSFIRLQELAQLNLDDMDLQAQRLFVRRAKMGKGRWAGFGPTTRRNLWQCLCLRQEITDTVALWVYEEGKPLSLR
jgi:site-specific recombinase XerD